MNDISSHCYQLAYSLHASGKISAATEVCLSAAGTSDPDCKMLLASMLYSEGSFEKAIECLDPDGNLTIEDTPSCYFVACCLYAMGDYEKALKLFTEASQRGAGRANHWIGAMHREGLGTPVDFEKATQYFKTGSKEGYLVARRGLIHIENLKGGFFKSIINFPSYLKLLFDVLTIGFKNIHDERLVDAPNSFRNCRWLVKN